MKTVPGISHRLPAWWERILISVTQAQLQGAGAGPGAPFPDPAACGCADRLGNLIASLPRDRRLLLRMGCRTLDLVAFLRFRRRFAGLTPAEACRLLEALAASHFGLLRRLVCVVRMLTQYAYFCSDATWQAIGYDGPWIGRIEVEVMSPPDLGAMEGP